MTKIESRDDIFHIGGIHGEVGQILELQFSPGSPFNGECRIIGYRDGKTVVQRLPPPSKFQPYQGANQ